jgi:hypothetical protein
MATYTFLTNGDRWEGLAVDGDIVTQRHEVTAQDALNIAKTGPEIDQVEKVIARANEGYRPSRWPGSLDKIRESEEWRLIE